MRVEPIEHGRNDSKRFSWFAVGFRTNRRKCAQRLFKKNPNAERIKNRVFQVGRGRRERSGAFLLIEKNRNRISRGEKWDFSETNMRADFPLHAKRTIKFTAYEIAYRFWSLKNVRTRKNYDNYRSGVVLILLRCAHVNES